jgi:hypothetical protein
MQRKSSKERGKRTKKRPDPLYADQRQADAILRFLDSPINPFLRVAVVDALADAARRIGHPLLAPALVKGKLTVTPNSNPHFQDLRKGLEDLICLTKLRDFSLEHSADEKIAEAIWTILQTEETPEYLFNQVGDFVTTASSGSIKRFWTVPLLVHTLSFSRAEEAEEAEKEREEQEAQS